MPGDNVKTGKGKGSRRHIMRGNEESLTRYDSDCDSLPTGVRKRLNELFAGIEKEFENLYAENVALQERVDTLTERLEGGDKLTAENQDVVDGANKPKRSASQISQKIKTTYKVSTSKIVSSFRNPQPAFALVRHYKGHRDGVWEVMVSRSGQPVLGTASADHTARIWCIQNGQCLLQYQGHQGSVNSIRFHPDKELALTSSGDNTAHIWGAQVSVPSDTGKKYWRSHSSGEDDVEGSEMEEYAEGDLILAFFYSDKLKSTLSVYRSFCSSAL
ncbi:hypothetical protein FSP39_019120 [Pinctada imbricata]|uniref:WD repeat-containing protein 37 n=1 Tax=Pinctada imbricata TaxID=66713 RepID=A0AA88YAH6_PINIB|nr:hypothetical protein FSP39_019120 [Pinctada imbricata]